jgi:hypothetical protein
MPLKQNNIDPQASVNELLGSDTSITGYASKAAAAVTDFVNPANFGSITRSIGSSLPLNGMSPTRSLTQAQGASKPGEKDWRVKLSVPDNFTDSRLLMPLLKTGGFAFPFTPSIIMSHSANYSSHNPAHTNYAMNSFNYSSVDQIQINGDFFVQNGLEAEYWIAAVHYLRSVTKMRYGESSSDAGSPPPVVLLNGYGDFVFKNLPVVVTSFNVELPADVDYISTGLNAEVQGDFDQGTYKNVAWAPAQSQFTVTLLPQFSRASVSQFNMNDFVKGNYIKGNGGFI